MLQRRVENEGTQIGGTGLDFAVLDFQHMTELQMGVRNPGIEFERFAVGLFGLREVPGLLERVAVLNPDRRVVRLLIERLLVILRRRHPVARVPRPVGSGHEPRTGSRDKAGGVLDRLQNGSGPRGRRRGEMAIFRGASTSRSWCPACEKLLRCCEVLFGRYTRGAMCVVCSFGLRRQNRPDPPRRPQFDATSFLEAALDDIRYTSRLSGPAVGSHPISLPPQDVALAVFVVEQCEDPFSDFPGIRPGEL